MTPKLHSINGLSTETGMDRRTIAKRLAGLPPDGKVGGHDAWFMKSAWPHLVATDRAAPGGADAEVERARLLRAQADMAELRLARERGQVVDASTIARQWATTFRTIRDILRSMPRAAVDRVLAKSVEGRTALAAALLAEIDDCLTRCSNIPVVIANDDDDGGPDDAA